MESIKQQGLKSCRRHHVHLSADYETAVKVGSRHGMPVVLQIDTAQMGIDGFVFYLSVNRVWLTDAVAPKYFMVSDTPQQ
jgi:putative RNA 2'-phosphotransferase